MELNFATAWEAIADEIPESDAIACGDRVFSWAEYEDRSARVATALSNAGVSVGGNVGLCLYNGPEYSEAQFAAFKQRATPFNVNYRYTASELRSLLAEADTEALFFDASLADAIAEIRSDLGGLKLAIQVGPAPVPDWAVGYDSIIEGNDKAPRIERSPNDIWMLFTGGTTGNPKGVMWPHGNMIQTMKASYSGVKLAVPQTIDELLDSVRQIHATGRTMRQLAAAPLMHGTSGITALTTHMMGGTSDP